jgi:hypothetical protein
MVKTSLQALGKGLLLAGALLALAGNPLSAADQKPAADVPPTIGMAQHPLIGTLAGDATIVRREVSQKVTVADRDVEVRSADRIVLNSGESCFLEFPDGRKIKFSGEGEYQLHGQEIKIIRGGFMVSFKSSPKGYKVRLPTSTLGIRGTLLHIKIGDAMEWVWVDEGCIDWENNLTGKKGVLSTGEGVHISGKTSAPIKSSPLFEKDPIRDETLPGRDEKPAEIFQAPEPKAQEPKTDGKKPVKYNIKVPFSDK